MGTPGSCHVSRSSSPACSCSVRTLMSRFLVAALAMISVTTRALVPGALQPRGISTPQNPMDVDMALELGNDTATTWRSAQKLATYAHCAFNARGRIPPLALGKHGSSPVSLHTCMQLLRGEGWEPLITTELGGKVDDSGMLRLWSGLLSSGSLSSLPFEPRLPDPLSEVARFFAAVGAGGASPRVCIVGDSMSRNLAMDLTLGRAALLGDPAFAKQRGAPLATLQYHSNLFGLDTMPRRHCHRLCKARQYRAASWSNLLTDRGCTTAIVEPASTHWAQLETSPAFLAELNSTVHAALANCSRAGACASAEQDADALAFRPMADDRAAIIARVLAQNRVPRLWKEEVRRLAETLDTWAAAAPGRVAILRASVPQTFAVTGEFTELTKRPTRAPGRTYTHFSTRRCTCQELHPAIAHSNVLGQMCRHMAAYFAQSHSPSGGVAPPSTNTATKTSPARVRFADTYSPLAFAPEKEFSRTNVGCHNTGARGVSGCMSSLAYRHRVRPSAPPLTEGQRAFAKAGADDFCDCTHSGFNPYKLGLVAGVLADAVVGSTTRTPR
mmetsp:Transcript_24453/g.56614  ORF Transcript_24453/g.56614 Transcript_24453/m.56614 type:complete len:557 (+) Transcript_24453:3-1673(+)